MAKELRQATLQIGADSYPRVLVDGECELRPLHTSYSPVPVRRSGDRLTVATWPGTWLAFVADEQIP